jgi:hypothetical protein
MASRLKLHDEFIDLIGSRNEEDKRVYFQPPVSVKMKYRCIRYSKDGTDLLRANDKIYRKTNRYNGVVIDTNPDSDLPDKLLEHFQMCSLGRPYVVDNLHHFPFTIYY